ncbi:MAG: signal recognition particle-docking protein FtsY [Anaerolineae bacterium]
MFQLFKTTFQKVKNALGKTRSRLKEKIYALFAGPIDETTFEALEQIFYEVDLGSACAADFAKDVREFLRKSPTSSIEEALVHIRTKALEILTANRPPLPREKMDGSPHVILIVGVNGSGKTTSVAKLAHAYKKEGKKVLLAAADTFRAAAIDQLAIWADRIGIDIVKAKPNSDPSAVVFDALSAAKARAVDVVLIDTAGRLQNKTALMQELEKMRRTAAKIISDAPHETLLVLDATTGQNAIDQARTFHQFTPLSGLVLTKLDGSAKGGIILAIYKELNIPVLWIGTGENSDDLIPFDPQSYIDALFEL